MDISEVLIEENNQTNKHPARRRDAGYLSRRKFFFLSVNFTSHYLLFIPLYYVVCIKLTQIKPNIITHITHLVHILPTTTPAVSQSSSAIQRKKIISIYI